MKKKKKSSKIKICFVSIFGYPLYNTRRKKFYGGGSEIQLYLLSKELAKNKNLSINVLTGDSQFKAKRIETINDLNINVALSIKKTFFNKIRGLMNFYLALIKINPDIVIQRIATVDTGLCALYCKLFKKKFIYSISSVTSVNGYREKGILGKIYKFGFDNADFIIAQNKEQVLELHNYKKRKFNNITIIKSGNEIKNLTTENKNVIIWVGRSVVLKRPKLFLKLAQELPDYKFLMICYKSIDEQRWYIIKKKASEISNLRFIEFIPFKEIDIYFRRAKLLINTSSIEGFPNTYIQAFISKTPVVSLNVNPDDLFTKNEVGFFCNDDFNEMKENIKLLMDDFELYESYSKNAFLYVKYNHDIKKISNEWLQLIKKLLS